jgi:hypothetical protein
MSLIIVLSDDALQNFILFWLLINDSQQMRIYGRVQVWESERKWSLDLLPQPRPYPTPQAHPFSKFWTHHSTCTCCHSTVTVWSLTAHTYRQPLSVLGVNVVCHERKMNAATDKVSLTQQRPDMFFNNAWFASSKRGPKQYSLYATKLV